MIDVNLGSTFYVMAAGARAMRPRLRPAPGHCKQSGRRAATASRGVLRIEGRRGCSHEGICGGDARHRYHRQRRPARNNGHASEPRRDARGRSLEMGSPVARLPNFSCILRRMRRRVSRARLSRSTAPIYSCHMNVAQVISALLGAYAVAGVIFACAFVSFGIARVDGSAARAPFGFR